MQNNERKKSQHAEGQYEDAVSYHSKRDRRRSQTGRGRFRGARSLRSTREELVLRELVSHQNKGAVRQDEADFEKPAHYSRAREYYQYGDSITSHQKAQ